MNVLVDIRPKLPVAIVHDLVCPWCYLGTRRLRRALAKRPDLVVELIWRPFLLNPDMPRAGMTRAEYVGRKFGSEERARRLNHSIAELGEAEGLRFRFDRIVRMPSSVDAHRLVRHASLVAPALTASLVEALFAAMFTEGRDIGDPRVLLAIAVENGLDPAPVRRLLAGIEGADLVHTENLRSHRLGINGVPCFILGERTAIAGAQDPEVIERLLDAASVQAALVSRV